MLRCSPWLGGRVRVGLLAGKRVAAAFDLGAAEYFRPVRLDGGPVLIVVPHPSGRCRWRNDWPSLARERNFYKNLRKKLQEGVYLRPGAR